MLKYQNWYAGIWIAVVGLYALGWSSLNGALDPALLVFFGVSIVVSIIMAALSSPIPLVKLRWVKRRKPVITIAVFLGFLVDWAYRGSLPVLQSYQGYDPTSTAELSVGIPVFHVVLMAFAIFYTMYLSYLYLSDTQNKGYLWEFLLLIGMLILNYSRGYVVFCLFIMLLLYSSFNSKGIKQTKVGSIVLIVLAAFGVIIFISAAGNIRSGYSWNDCSYIETIGYFNNYPDWLTKHFMWGYSYATSPLANLNLNCLRYNGNLNFAVILFSFLPEQLSAGPLAHGVTIYYVVNHLNAVTGFATFVGAAGVGGAYAAFAGMILLYTFVKVILKKFRVLETFGNALLCFLALSMIFFNCFTTSALCYIPFFLIVASYYLNRRLVSNDIVLLVQEPHPDAPEALGSFTAARRIRGEAR